MSITLLIVLLVTFLGLSAFFSTSETALFSLSPSKRKTFTRSDHKGKRSAAYLLDRPKSLLITILMMNIAVNLGVQNIISSIFGDYSGFILTVLFPFVLTLIFGEILPKAIAVTKDEAISSKVAPIILFVSVLLTPVRYVFLKITNIASHLVSIFLKKDSEITKEEIKHALVSSKNTGLMTKDEVKLLLGSLRLSEMQVKEVMCPRQSIFYHDVNSAPQKLRDLFEQKRLSKIPVVDRDINNVIGIVHATSFFKLNHRIHEASDLKKLIRPAFFVPESMLARTLLAHFDEKKEELACLVDEYGEISGLITKEDLVEIVVGQIKDVREEKTLYTKQGEDVIICSGKYELNDLEQMFDIEIKRKSLETTVGGYLLEILGDIPRSGYKVTENGLMFHVLLATESKVSRVYIKHLKIGAGR